MTAVTPRERPRARPGRRAPSPNFARSHIPAHLYPPSNPSAMATSLDSGLNKFGPTRESRPSRTKVAISRDLEQQQHLQRQQQQHKTRNSENKCKSVYMTLDDSEMGLDQFGQPYFIPQARRNSDPTRDEFGHTPFTASQEQIPITAGPRRIPDSSIDEFGAPQFTPAHSTSRPSPSSHSNQDMFGSRPFVQSTDVFGAAPFVTS